MNPPEGSRAIDSIVVSPGSRGVLNVGEGSREKRHQRYRIVVSATVKEGVKTEEKLLGSEEHYTAIVEVLNYNDSPAFVYAEATE